MRLRATPLSPRPPSCDRAGLFLKKNRSPMSKVMIPSGANGEILRLDHVVEETVFAGTF